MLHESEADIQLSKVEYPLLGLYVAALCYYLFIFAHESLRVTVRLNTNLSGVESVSGQK